MDAAQALRGRASFVHGDPKEVLGVGLPRGRRQEVDPVVRGVPPQDLENLCGVEVGEVRPLPALGHEDHLAVSESGVRVGEDRDEGGDVVVAVDMLASVPPRIEVNLVLVLDPTLVLGVVVDLPTVRYTLKLQVVCGWFFVANCGSC